MSHEIDVWVPTVGGRGERHPGGCVGYLFRIGDPSQVSMGHCPGVTLTRGDLALCVAHSGDCFQDYELVIQYHDSLKLKGIPFGSYGLRGATRLGQVPDLQMAHLRAGHPVYFAPTSRAARVYIATSVMEEHDRANQGGTHAQESQEEGPRDQD